MDYKKIYESLIEKRKDGAIDGYSEKHHIVPRCLSGGDNKENIVLLTAEEHFLAHLLLCKIHPGHSGLVAAAMFMCGGINGKRNNNKTYGWLRRRLSNQMRENNPNSGGKARLAYIEKHGSPPTRTNYQLSKAGKKKLQKFGSDNPMYNVKPWEHGRATEYTKSIWKQADVLYTHWINNNHPSYAKLYNWHNGVSYNSRKDGTISPYMNIYKYFKRGWVPAQDEMWNVFNKGQIS